jgi:hypothetical protein
MLTLAKRPRDFKHLSHRTILFPFDNQRLRNRFRIVEKDGDILRNNGAAARENRPTTGGRDSDPAKRRPMIHKGMCHAARYVPSAGIAMWNWKFVPPTPRRY